MNNHENSNINNNNQENRVLIKNLNKIDNLETNDLTLKNLRIDYFDWLRILCSSKIFIFLK